MWEASAGNNAERFCIERNGEHTKVRIYGTIGPACQDTDTLVRLFEKGMTGIRMNLSHVNLEEAGGWIENIHAAAERYQAQERKAGTRNTVEPLNSERVQQLASQGMPIQGRNDSGVDILMDLRGPELRIGKLGTSRELKGGDGLTLVPEGENNLFDPTEIPVPRLILPHLAVGQEILLDDGILLLKVDELFRTKNGCVAECKVLRGGLLKSGKSIALPGLSLYPPTLTDSDLQNIKVAKKYGITGVMLPFVRNADDLRNLKQALINNGAGDLKIFAKIENLDGVRQLSGLLPHCDEVVIARGDLGNAMPLWELPVVQAQIAELCRQAKKPFMVVTQMLASMEQAAVPTRAEVSDIFRAVSEGAASVMLTGETAAGNYPVEAMEYMVNTVREAEKYFAL